MRIFLLSIVILFFSTTCHCQLSTGNAAGHNEKNFTAYLFTYFTGNSKSEEAIRFALSTDGYSYRALNNNQPVISSEKISSTGGIRDPHILRGADGHSFYMVATDMISVLGWDSNRAMVLLKSTDLLQWTSAVVNIQKTYPGQEQLERVWAPQTIYDKVAGKYMIYWSMKYKDGPDRIYYAYANKDFTGLEGTPRQLFFSPGDKSCIDADIVYKDGKYHLFFKTEGHGNGIKQAVSDSLTSGYVLQDKYLQQTTVPVEGSSIFKLNSGNGYILMYDMYSTGKYQFTYTDDLEQFKVVDESVEMNFHPRHGTIIPITTGEAERLVTKWGTTADVVLSAHSKAIKKINMVYDTAGKKVILPVSSGTRLNSFDPQFIHFPGTSISPASAQDFSSGSVKYKVAIKEKSVDTFEVIVKEYHNPVLDGYYADPDILYAEQTGKFYIYPTSDGFNNWAGNYFKAFSSMDLVNWKDEGVILDLPKSVSWGQKNAWAPCIIEKKVNGKYKYFYYFTAAQKIGVAVSDSPVGPFTDLGKPLIDQFPEGVKDGQQIDPDVFSDPVSGKNYLYWGNNYMAGAELNEDMVSIKPGSIKLLTPDASFREGAHVFYRNGKYYFMWSEDDTRSENYRVRYGTSDSPLSAISVPPNNLVIAKNKEAGIYATGHNSTIKIPGKDEWYIVYHRFTYPKGIGMGEAAGYNREVCLDRMQFNDDGSIRQVVPTHEGIKPVITGGKGDVQ